ncbi:PH domain-containing protein [Thalassobacillus sp. CUG 92003]|uniref:PH domain-containing protein n=1 Tax=Thalassobacillus sp. CUG 92003 TaxID=2736641 RepID=UPI0015E6C511|nr:PH domain-containing protein [Thalassobacillus sp. CUG 92003]
MGFLDGIMGNASEVDLKDVEDQLEDIISDNERVTKAYKILRDMMIFTDKRLILVDKQGMTGKKVEYHSVPYRSITHFSVETAGTFDLDAELNIWISGKSEPIAKQFKKDDSIYDIQKTISDYVTQ